MIKFSLLFYFCFPWVSWVFRGKTQKDERKVFVIVSLYFLGDNSLK